MTLRRIVLRDFVIVPALELDFSPGFTVLTGETGAGKSILIDALQLVLGARADATVVREGATQAEICAEFDTPAQAQPWLAEAGFVPEETLLLRRVIDAQGRSRAWMNGSPATATQLRYLGALLLDIHGQHAWQSLMQPESVRSLLDAYAGIQSRTVQRLWQAWRTANLALSQAQAAQASLQQERERLLWQLEELDKLSPGADEWELLNHQHTRLSHAQALLETAQNALLHLDHDEVGADRPLRRSLQLLQDHAHLEPAFDSIAAVLHDCLAHLADAQHSLQHYLDKAEPDPQQLAELDTRLGLWMQLARRYRCAPQELPQLQQAWQTQLQALDAAADLPHLMQQAAQARDAYMEAAQALAQQRREAAPRLAHAITEAMQTLGMQGGRFAVHIHALAEPGAQGLDDVQFRVAGHPGATPRPLGKVASGGELSRLSLAIAVATSALGSAGTLIFDEVDSGVGGAVADTVGRLLHRLGCQRQVLAVTHLPQVAAYADQHYVVSKKRSKSSTSSTVTPCSEEARTHEIARMLGGEKTSATTLAHAREMLAHAHIGRSTAATSALEGSSA